MSENYIDVPKLEALKGVFNIMENRILQKSTCPNPEVEFRLEKMVGDLFKDKDCTICHILNRMSIPK